LKSREKFLAVSDWADSAARRIWSGFLSEEDRKLLTERFGLPALEAMALGCPVVASNTANLPEVCGDAVLFADPKSPCGWLAEIERLRAEPGLARYLCAKGARQAKRFSWKTSAQA